MLARSGVARMGDRWVPDRRYPARAAASWARDSIPSLRNVRARCASTVFCVTNRRWATWRFVSPGGGHLRDAELARRQGVAAARGRAPRTRAGGEELLERPLLEAAGAAAVGQRHFLLEQLAGGLALVRTPLGGAELDERLRELVPRAGVRATSTDSRNGSLSPGASPYTLSARASAGFAPQARASVEPLRRESLAYSPRR